MFVLLLLFALLSASVAFPVFPIGGAPVSPCRYSYNCTFTNLPRSDLFMTLNQTNFNFIKAGTVNASIDIFSVVLADENLNIYTLFAYPFGNFPPGYTDLCDTKLYGLNLDSTQLYEGLDSDAPIFIKFPFTTNIQNCPINRLKDFFDIEMSPPFNLRFFVNSTETVLPFIVDKNVQVSQSVFDFSDFGIQFTPWFFPIIS
jgi:hypothetical protein